jgi:hypothetical protein
MDARKCVMRVAVLGLYNSGSTAIAGMLAALGINMGPPYWTGWGYPEHVSYYEPHDLGHHLRIWWDEPRLIERVCSAHRVEFFRRWIELQEVAGYGAPCGAKHPLLSLSAVDVLKAWGPETRFVWAYRPLDESIEGLKRRAWFEGFDPVAIQCRLWDALHAASARISPLRLDWSQVKANPRRAVDALCEFTAITPSAAQRATAAAFVRPTS